VATNDPDTLPASTVIVAGRLTFAFPLVRFTITPDLPAGWESVTLQLDDPGAFTVIGEQVIEISCEAGES
jgi:hypothetical protein